MELRTVFQSALERLYDQKLNKCKNVYPRPDEFIESVTGIELVEECFDETHEYYKKLEDVAHSRFGDGYDEVLSRHIIWEAIRFLRQVDPDDIEDVARNHFEYESLTNDPYNHYGVSKSEFL